jgi:hypothetical protein
MMPAHCPARDAATLGSTVPRVLARPGACKAIRVPMRARPWRRQSRLAMTRGWTLLAMIGLEAAGLTACVSAWAQNAPIQARPLPPIQATPLAPPQTQRPEQGSPPARQVPGSPNPMGQGVPEPVVQGQIPAAVPSAAAPGAAAWPNVWVPARAAKIQALDKINAQASDLTIVVGQSATFGSLTITVKACMTRPADQPADATAYLDVTDSHPDSPGFDGWMLEDEPSVSMMRNPIYDLRVTGCA